MKCDLPMYDMALNHGNSKLTCKTNFDSDLMRRARIIDASSAGTAIVEIYLGHEYSNEGGETH